MKTPIFLGGPEILLTPVGDLAPHILKTPVGIPGSQILKTPGGALGRLINAAEDNTDLSSWLTPLPQMTYQTYIKVNPETGQIYAGKTSGRGTPQENVARRNYGHAYNKRGFGPAQLDQSSTNEDAIKGREQMLIDYYVSLGISGNRDLNPVVTNREYYIQQAIDEFGPLP